MIIMLIMLTTQILQGAQRLNDELSKSFPACALGAA